MDYTKKMDVINATALPMIPMDKPEAVLPSAGKAAEGAERQASSDDPSTCLIGSILQVNQTMAKMDPNPNLMANSLAIERFELEKKALREKCHSSPGDRGKPLSTDYPKRVRKAEQSCRGSEFKTTKSLLLKRKLADKNLLAELYQHPPFNDAGPNPLPNRVGFCDMVGNLVRAEKNPFTGKCFCSERELEDFLSSPLPRAMWLDSFWWIFHERYQPNKEIQNKLFDRIAQNYALLLFRQPRSRYEEALLKRLPSLLSKGLYTSFCCCFPQSWFNTHEFKSIICDTMSLWITGTCPCPQSYNSWDYSELDPERFRREELLLQRKYQIQGREFSFFTAKGDCFQKLVNQKKPLRPPFSAEKGSTAKLNAERSRIRSPMRVLGSKPMPNAHNCLDCERGRPPWKAVWRFLGKLKIDIPFDPPMPLLGIFPEELKSSHKDYQYQSPILRKTTERTKMLLQARQRAQELSIQSHPACKSPPLTTNLFNIHGKSPLIVYFLRNLSHLPQHGQDVLVARSEKTEVTLESTPTYADVIGMLLSNMQNRRSDLARLSRLHQSEWRGFDSYMRRLQDNFLREVRNIDKQAAEKRHANHAFVLPSGATGASEDMPKGTCRGSCYKERVFLLRKEREPREAEEKRVGHSPTPRPEELCSLRLGLHRAWEACVAKGVETMRKTAAVARDKTRPSQPATEESGPEFCCG